MSESIEHDPPRLRDDPTMAPAIGSALAAGRGYTPSAEARARTLAALGVSAAVVTTASATSATAVVAAPGAAKVLVGWKGMATLAALAIGLGGVGYVALRRPSDAPSRPSSTNATNATNAAISAASTPSSVAAPAPSEEIAPIVGSANPIGKTTNTTNDGKPNVAKAKGAPSSDTLAAEVAAIDAARNALRSGDAAGALRLLDAYGHDFPKGSLGLEAQVLRIEALAASGQKQKARVLAERFLAAHPNSVLAPRLKAILQP